MSRLRALSFISLVSLAALTACPPTGVVCKAGTIPCGTGCVDPQSDRRNCGACGTACFSGQDCNAGSCACRSGTVACNSACVVTDYDAKNCGQCGVQCATGQVCELGICKASCSGSTTRCGASCVDLSGDVAHCGACDNTCAQGQQCVNGSCDYAAVAACYWSGQLVGFDPSTGVKGPLSDMGSNPAALARLGTTVLVSDQTDHRIYAALPSASGTYQRSKFDSPAGAVANQLLVDRPYVYVANAGSGSVLVLKEGVDAGVMTLDAGADGTLVLGAVTELQLGMNSYPQGVVKVGSTLWVPLYGGFGADADAGQELQKIDVTNPDAPALQGRVSLKSLDLHAFDGGTPVARPWAITASGTTVYVALNNLNPDTYAPEGPGLVAKVDTANNDALSVIDLGGGECLNPQWLSMVGDRLVVSCGGVVTYSPTFTVDAVSAAGVVAVDSSGARVGAAWTVAGQADADAGFLPMMPGRFAVSSGRVVLGDQNGGRAVILSVTDAGVTEVRGVSNALNLCPVSSVTGVGNVADIVSR